MGMRCRCGGEIDFTTGKCKKCHTQNIKMRGNASIKITDTDGNTTELISRKKKELPDNTEENSIKFKI